MKIFSRGTLFMGLVTLSVTSQAIEPIPQEAGWSGLVNVGLAYFDGSSNMIAGVDAVSIDIGNPVISSLSESPDSESFGMPQVNLNIKYTFSTQTQLFAGSSMEDIVQFDTASVVGVRQQFTDRSIIELSTVSTPLLSPVQVWSDPYVVGVERQQTDRTSRGARLEYANILGTGFGVQYTQRKTELDDELSGSTQLGLTPAEAQLLDREGDVKRFVGYYRFAPIGRNIVELRLNKRSDDLDGDAMSGDQNQIQVTSVYLGERYIIASNIFVAQKDYDAVNPVFGVTRESDTLGLGFVLLDKNLFSSKDWYGQASLVWVDKDSNIDFYDVSSTMISAGAQYRF
jgi:hypothetical protein